MPSHKSFPPIQLRLAQFLEGHFESNPSEVDVIQLEGDASARQYYRCIMANGVSYILVAYPEPFLIESFTYGQIYDLFREIGVPVPETVAMEESLGIVLQQDLGDTLLIDNLKGMDQKSRKLLLSKAIDHIVKIQVDGSAALGPGCDAYNMAFDKDKLLWELRYFHDYYLNNHSRAAVRNEEGLIREYEHLAAGLAGFPRVLCHRDFHVRNIMAKRDVLYVIDFQDARWGPPAYDLVSLLKDSLQLDERTVVELTEYYLRRIRRNLPAGIGGEVFAEQEFSRQFQLMCIQRLLKALGTYGFQASVRKKASYLRYIKGTLQRALVSLRKIPEFPEVEWMVRQELSRKE